MPRGLIEVGIDRQHEVDRVEGIGQAGAVGRGQHRIAADSDHRPDLTVTGCLDLLGEGDGGQFGHHLRIARDAAVPAARCETATRARRPGCGSHR